MSFLQIVKVSLDRVGALVGKSGQVKKEIEDRCGVAISVNGETGEAMIRSAASVMEMRPFKAVEIVNAIGRGFSPERAFRLLDEEVVSNVLDLRDYAGKSENALKRVKGRIIGVRGKARTLIEDLSGAYVSVYGHYVGIIGAFDEVRLASDAIERLASGSSHRVVYEMLQKIRTREKLARMGLVGERKIAK